MAFSIDDFNKIWASQSPLTPYSFSDSNYKEGWNFVGATPPSRQMWDYLQKQNDEKLKYLLDNFDNYLPLSGGTMTGAITLDDGGNPLSTSGGTMTGAIKGNPVTLTADDGNGNSADMVVNANGVATLGGNNIATTNLVDFTVTPTSALQSSYSITFAKRFGNLCMFSFSADLVSSVPAYSEVAIFTMSVSSVAVMECVGRINDGNTISLQVRGNQVFYRSLGTVTTDLSVRGVVTFFTSDF